jgi:hypothetical protein
MPIVFDTGHAGTWRDMLANSPCLNASDYAPADNAERLEASRPAVVTILHEHTTGRPSIDTRAAVDRIVCHGRGSAPVCGDVPFHRDGV